MTDFIVIRGNPVLQNDKDVDCLTKYNELREVIRATDLDLVELNRSHIVMEGFGVKRSIRYPKDVVVTTGWVIIQVQAFNEVAPLSAAFKKAPPQCKPFLNLAERLIRDSGTLEIIDDVLTLRWRTYEGRMRGFSKLPTPIQTRAKLLVKQSAELARLRSLAKANKLL